MSDLELVENARKAIGSAWNAHEAYRDQPPYVTPAVDGESPIAREKRLFTELNRQLSELWPRYSMGLDALALKHHAATGWNYKLKYLQEHVYAAASDSDGLRPVLRECIDQLYLLRVLVCGATSNESNGGSGSETPADELGELRTFAHEELKGQERAVIEALCASNGELPISNLAVTQGVNWEDPFQGFKDVQRRLNPKLKKKGWKLERQANAAKLKALK